MKKPSKQPFKNKGNRGANRNEEVEKVSNEAAQSSSKAIDLANAAEEQLNKKYPLSVEEGIDVGQREETLNGEGADASGSSLIPEAPGSDKGSTQKKSKEPKPFAPFDLSVYGFDAGLTENQKSALLVLERALFIRRQCKRSYAGRSVFESKLGQESVNDVMDAKVLDMLNGFWVKDDGNVGESWISDDGIHQAFVKMFVTSFGSGNVG